MLSWLRLGKLESKNFSDTERQTFASVKNVSFIHVLDVGSFISHAYFLDSPSASLDQLHVVRDSSRPSSENRPLIHKEGNFWEMPADYPNNRQ